MLNFVLRESGGRRRLARSLGLSLCCLLLHELLSQEHRSVPQAQAVRVVAVEALEGAGTDALDVRDASDRLGDLLQFQQDDLVADVGALVVDPVLQKSLRLWRLILVDFLQKLSLIHI